jgi:peptidyl-prolyl cis-trans isomerase SurA
LKRKLVVFAALAACALACACKKEAAPSPDAWAVVNSAEIKRDEVQKYYRTRINPDSPAPSQEEGLSLKLSILEELINNEILLERAAKLNLTASDAEVEDKFTESKSPYTEEEFQRKLKDSGISVEDLKHDLRRQISIQKLLNREVVAKISVTDQDVTDFYDINKAQFNVAEPQFRIAQIVVTPRANPQLHNRKNDDATNELEARHKIDMIEQQLTAGVDFSQLAMDYSEDANASAGGDLGFVPESALNSSDPALRDTVLKLRVGEISKPIAQRDGYRILKLLGREPAGQRVLVDPNVQQTIRDTLRNRKEQLLRAAYLSTLRDEAHITNFLARQVLESAGKLPSGK